MMRFKKVVLPILVVLIVALSGYGWLVTVSNRLSSEEFDRLDKARLEDIRLLEELLKGRVSYEETLAFLKANKTADSFFVKSHDFGIGVSGLFLRFDKKGRLETVEAHSWKGP